MNLLSSAGIPFLFIIDSFANQGFIIPENEIDANFIQFKLHQVKTDNRISDYNSIQLEKTPVSESAYARKFSLMMQEIHRGNTFLINLTQPTNLTTNLSLKDFYDKSAAAYKLWLKDQFVVFSPETFVKIQDGKIFTYPMKGTIDASVPDAHEVILKDEKEMAEHATIVDLLRNDLSIVAENVRVTKYRYVERVNTNQGELLQVSSEISGDLPVNYLQNTGEIIFKLLPAGSVTGAPKEKTVEIIQRVEGYERGFYTGVFGYFDGMNLDSAVMIRYVEQTENGLVYKSGGGITFQSEMEKEYKELIQKVYVPVF